MVEVLVSSLLYESAFMVWGGGFGWMRGKNAPFYVAYAGRGDLLVGAAIVLVGGSLRAGFPDCACTYGAVVRSVLRRHDMKTHALNDIRGFACGVALSSL